MTKPTADLAARFRAAIESALASGSLSPATAAAASEFLVTGEVTTWFHLHDEEPFDDTSLHGISYWARWALYWRRRDGAHYSEHDVKPLEDELAKSLHHEPRS